jgi:hypothetical protein
MNGSTLFLKITDQPHGSLPFGGNIKKKIIIVQLRIGIGFMSILKCLYEVVLPDYLIPPRVPKRPVEVHRFVDNIPAVHSALISPDNGMYMLAHSVEQSFATELISGFVFEYPFGSLIMPDECMPDDEHTVFFSDSYKTIRCIEVVHPGFRMYLLPFHHVLCGNGVELLPCEFESLHIGNKRMPVRITPPWSGFDKLGRSGIGCINMLPIDGGTHQERIFECILQIRNRSVLAGGEQEK